MEACLQGLAIPPWFISSSTILLLTILVVYAVTAYLALVCVTDEIQEEKLHIFHYFL